MLTFRHCLLLSALSLGACSEIPKEAYFNRGDPESLLDASSEVVNVKLESRASIDELTQWVNQDQPTRAELVCVEGGRLCNEAGRVLEQFGVEVMRVSAPDNNVSLVYERVVARDCENRYIDNRINPYELHHPTFGCTLASNMVQMVSDKGQFVSPPMMDMGDGEKAVQTMLGARVPNVIEPVKIDRDFDSLFEESGASSGGGK